VLVSYKVGDDETVLTVEDDGIGGEDAQAAAGQGIGGTLMAAFARQVHGQFEEGKSVNGGRLVRVRISRGHHAGVSHDQPAAVPAK
jgi:two-component sensor histidine kinase